MNKFAEEEGRGVVFDDIDSERERQVALFGEQNHHPAYWLAIMGKQVGQLGDAIVQREWAAEHLKKRMLEKVRNEAIQIAAVATALVEAIDRGEVPHDLATAQPSDPRQRAKALGVGHEQMDYEGMGSEYEANNA